MLLYNEALGIIKKEFRNLMLPIEEVDLLDSTDRVLAEDITADVDLPPFDDSAMDGYAIRFSERRSWKIIGEISTGHYNALNLKISEAVLITTGSKIPPNADTVIPLEDVIVHDLSLKLKEDSISAKKGMNIRLKGNDLLKGSLAVNKYSKINSKIIAVLASCGKQKVKVFSKLRMGILATGDELISINDIPFTDKIRATNSFTLFSAIKEIGHIPLILGIAKDDKEAIRQRINTAFEMNLDLLITTGGVSVGKYDFIKEVFEEEKIKELFWRVNIKPGKPIYFGVREESKKRILVFGLPGNPVSSLVGFYIFIKPAIEYLYHEESRNTISAILMNDIKKHDGKKHFSRGNLYKEDDELKVTVEFGQSSGNLVEMSHSNCLVIIDEEKRNPAKGEKVECILI